MTDGLTGCNEKIKGFIGRKPVLKKTQGGGLAAYFDISWGLNDPTSDKFGTWRHCIAYNQNAEYIKDCKPGSYLLVMGWITTNPVYDEAGVKQIVDGKPVTKEYLVVNSMMVIPREKLKAPPQQLSLSNELPS
jgi:single-stranded DNA-binding protein